MEEKPSYQILIVDDEVGMREGCRRALSPAGYAVQAAADLDGARELLRTEAYDTYLLDVMLPDGSGLDLLAEILAGEPDAACIVITGFGTIEMAVEAVRRGAYDFLSKPFTSDELLVAVEQAIEWRRLRAIEREAEELARAKRDLERLDEVKSQLMLKVAHELRAPIAAVQSYINLIVAGYVDQSEMKPTLERVQARLQEMLDLIADLLELARLQQAGDQAMAQAGPQDVAQILEEVCDVLREQAQQKGQRLELDIVDRPVMTANRDHLKQIWTNLIGNAIKYTPQGGRVAVTLRREGENVVGEVEDTGMGIATEDLPHLFQEFFRTDEAKASGAIGTGLGLSIVKQIVDFYSGKIEVTSTPGQGSRFALTLPTEPPPPPEPAQAPSGQALPATRRPSPPRTHAQGIIFGQEERYESSR
ncbi:MAG: hybrid sensor histidine kinase/response regulator [Anaerolineae bacterium]